MVPSPDQEGLGPRGQKTHRRLELDVHLRCHTRESSTRSQSRSQGFSEFAFEPKQPGDAVLAIGFDAWDSCRSARRLVARYLGAFTRQGM